MKFKTPFNGFEMTNGMFDSERSEFETPFDNVPSEFYEFVPYLFKSAGFQLDFVIDISRLATRSKQICTQIEPSTSNAKAKFANVCLKRYRARESVMMFIMGAKLKRSAVLSQFPKDMYTLIGRYIWATLFDDVWLPNDLREPEFSDFNEYCKNKRLKK
jgi:hypothetical protein